MKKLLLKIFMLLCLVAWGGANSAWAEDVTGTITFGTNNVKIDNASVTGDDDLGNTWTITTEGTTSFTANASYYQVGASSKPATSITFTMTLPTSQTIKSMSAKFGGFSGTAGTVTLKVGDTSVGTGSLNATNDVTVSSTSSATGTVLTVTVTGISKGVKVYNITYTYNNGGSTPSTYNVSIANDIKNGTVSANPTSAAEGATVTLTATPSTGYEFGSWSVTNASTSAAITVTDNKFTMPAANVNVSATFNLIQGGGSDDEYTHDILTNADLAATSTTYTNFTNVSKNTAVYAGQSSKNNGIQLRATSPSGIVSTTSGGKIKNVSVTWNSNCTSGRTIDVYGSNTAYTSAADLYNNTKQGTKLGSVVMGTSTSVTVTGDYAYVGIRSNNGALNIDKIDFAWEECGDSSDDNPNDPSIATATFNGKNETYTDGWTTTGTGKNRTDCIVIGKDENITSPAFNLSIYSNVEIAFTGRKFGTLSGTKATVDVSIAGNSVGSLDITNADVATVNGTISFTPTADMTEAVLVFTCTNATSAGSTHGAGIGSITITGTLKQSEADITAVGYATFYNEQYAVILPAGVKGYIWNNGLKKTYDGDEDSKIIPAGEPVVLAATEGKYFLTYTATSISKSENNDLRGAAADMSATEMANANPSGSIFYGLSLNNAGDEGSVGFYWRDENGGAFEISAGKAYLVLSQSNARSGFAFNEDTESLESIDINSATTIYTLDGIKVNELQKGLNIVNGKKVMVK